MHGESALERSNETRGYQGRIQVCNSSQRSRPRERTSRRIPVVRYMRNCEMFGPGLRQGWKCHVPERNDARNAPVLSNLHHCLAIRHDRPIGSHDRTGETHDILECEKTARQHQATVRKVDVEAGDLFRDCGIAGENSAMAQNCAFRSEARAEQLDSAACILLCEGLEVSRKDFEGGPS